MTNNAKAMSERWSIAISNSLWSMLWKECCERRWWAACWVLVIVSVSLFANGQNFCNDAGWAIQPWNYLSLLFAGIVGLGGYSSELKRERAFFLFTRAVHWSVVLLAKILFGVIMILAAALLAALIFRLTCAEPYRHFVTLPHVLSGVGTLALPTVLCYFAGLAGSVILPGLAGGALTVISTIGITILLVFVDSALTLRLCENLLLVKDFTSKIDLTMLCGRVGMLSFAIVGIVWGALSVVRDGLYRDFFHRIRLFAPKFILTMLGGWLVGICLPQVLAEQHFLRWNHNISYDLISPGGSYAIISYDQNYSVFGIDARLLGENTLLDYRTDVIRLEDNSVVVSNLARNKHDKSISSIEWDWITDTIALGQTIASRQDNEGTPRESLIYHADTNTFITLTTRKYVNIGTPSPDGRLMVNIYDSEEKSAQTKKTYLRHIYLYNLMNGHTKDIIIPLGNNRAYSHFWWESNDTVAYYIYNGNYYEPHTMRLPLLEVKKLQVPQF